MLPQLTTTSFTIRCPNADDKSQTHIRVLVDGPLPLVGLSKLPPKCICGAEFVVGTPAPAPQAGPFPR
jgi:hypothetical protein